MAEAQALRPVGAAADFHVSVKGKVTRRYRVNGSVRTVITCPAPDEYSSPQVLELRSKRAIGGKDELINAVCRVGGFNAKEFDLKDKESGETIKFQGANLTLDVIED